MRILFENALENGNEVLAALYRRFVQRSLFRGYMSGTVTSGDGPYLSLNALVLEADELASLVDVSTRMARIFALAGQRVAEDLDALLAYGFPWNFAELLQMEPPSPMLFGRFDYLLDQMGTWQLLEYNCDTPAGFREATAVDQAAFELLKPYFKGSRINRGLVDKRLRAIRNALPRSKGIQRLGLLSDAADLEDTGHMAYLARCINKTMAGDIDVVLGDIDNMQAAPDGSLSLLGRRIDALCRYVTYETMLALPQFWMIVEAVTSGKLLLLNGLRGALLQNKGLLAWIWANRHDPIFSQAEQEAIQRHLPPTWWIKELPGDVDRRETVVKQVFGREGDEVYFGDAMADEDWEQCRQWGSFIVQQRIATKRLTALSWDWQGRPIQKTRLATVGGYVASEQWAGCYSRLGGRIINAKAEFVPTFLAG